MKWQLEEMTLDEMAIHPSICSLYTTVMGLAPYILEFGKKSTKCSPIVRYKEALAAIGSDTEMFK